MSKSSIEWTEENWNLSVGCTRVSPGCKNCYAARHHARMSGNPRLEKYRQPFEVVRPWPDDLDLPLHRRKPSQFFVNSMSDLFHQHLDAGYIRQAFAVMERAHWHIFQVLTKRAERLAKVAPLLPWPENVWMGVSVERSNYLDPVDSLRQAPAPVRFLSIEPLLGPVTGLSLEGIGWVIVGGESGPGGRPCQAAWVREIRDQCLEARVPFFFKQWGAISNNPDPKDRTAKENGGQSKGGCQLDGRLWRQMPRPANRKRRSG